MEIQYRSHIKDRNGVTFIAIINPVPNIEMAEEIEWEFNKQEIKDEEDGCFDYETKVHWVRNEIENGDNE